MTASVVPIIVGASLSINTASLNWYLFLATLFGSLSIQIATNLTDEYSDHIRGGSDKKFLAPHKVIARGLIAPKSVLKAAVVSYLLSLIFGFYIFSQTGWPILVFCIPAMIIAILYSAGPIPLGNKGISEVVVFILMGPAMVLGSYYVQTLELTPRSLLVSLPIGLLVALIMYCNNLRDLDEDADSGKTSLASFLGIARAKRTYFMVLCSSYTIIILSTTLGILSSWALISFVSIPLAIRALKFRFDGSAKGELNLLMVHTASIHFFTGIGLTIGLLIESLI